MKLVKIKFDFLNSKYRKLSKGQKALYKLYSSDNFKDKYFLEIAHEKELTEAEIDEVLNLIIEERIPNATE